MRDLAELFARNLRRQREQRGWTQAQLAERVGISVNFLSQVEGAKKFPSPRVIGQLIEALDVTSHHLFIDWEDPRGLTESPDQGERIRTYLEGLAAEQRRYTEGFLGKR